MPEETVRVLRLWDMIARRRGTFVSRVIHAVAGVSLRLFFRRVETSGAERVPESAPLVFVLNHPNGLIDPALVFCALPRRVSFLAKSTLFRVPVLNYFVRAVESLPVYRRVDEGEDTTRNLETFRACRELLRRGRCIALFPEGVSHNSTRLLPVRTGAARIALGAVSLSEEANEGAAAVPLKIMPVGLYYTSKTSFRSEALIRFGEPFDVAPATLDESGEPPREEVQQLSKRIEAALREVTLEAADEDELDAVTKAEQLFSSVYEGLNERPPLAATFRVLRRLAESFRLVGAHAPERVASLQERVRRYEEGVRDLGLTPEALSVSTHSGWYVLRHFVLRGVVILLLSPFALAGAVLHLPAYLAANFLSHRFTTHGADAIGPTVKILAAMLLVPLTWLVIAVVAYFFSGWRLSLPSVPVAALCGYVAVRCFEAAYDMRAWYGAVVLLARRRGLFLRLLIERRALHDEIVETMNAER
ncbi:MAG TPA: lysophospholipid acyltransferase family protein [Pyrinomonadaceae bacterium]|nr:lysophospholipid acyltransferase family protein [Pyrinomonadaceae bacterium]